MYSALDYHPPEDETPLEIVHFTASEGTEPSGLPLEGTYSRLPDVVIDPTYDEIAEAYNTLKGSRHVGIKAGQGILHIAQDQGGLAVVRHTLKQAEVLEDGRRKIRLRSMLTDTSYLDSPEGISRYYGRVLLITGYPEQPYREYEVDAHSRRFGAHDFNSFGLVVRATSMLSKAA